jgi:hypothetical protein
MGKVNADGSQRGLREKVKVGREIVGASDAVICDLKFSWTAARWGDDTKSMD